MPSLVLKAAETILPHPLEPCNPLLLPLFTRFANGY
jgi:hypothetical protein